jgi:hypothetical protein
VPQIQEKNHNAGDSQQDKKDGKNQDFFQYLSASGTAGPDCPISMSNSSGAFYE